MSWSRFNSIYQPTVNLLPHLTVAFNLTVKTVTYKKHPDDSTEECLEFEKAETLSPKGQCKLFYGSQDSLGVLPWPRGNTLKRDGDVVQLNAEK